jgi:hypothetical protein
MADGWESIGFVQAPRSDEYPRVEAFRILTPSGQSAPDCPLGVKVALALMPAEHVDAFRRANRGFNTSYD